MTICRLLRSLLRDKKDSNEGQSSVGEAIVKVLMYCFKWILDTILQLIKYISDKALVVCAVHGTAFWDSVKRISKIFLKDVLLVVAVENVAGIVLGVCKFIVALLAAGTTFAFAEGGDKYNGTLIIICIVVFIFAYDLCSVLFTSYDVAIDTILVCTCKLTF